MEGSPEQRDWRPIPDPTALTTEALRREIGGLKELLENRIDAVLDKAMEQSQEITERLDREEQHRLEKKDDTQRAVEAALTAQEKATEKAEVATAKQLEEIKQNVGTTVDSLRRELGDLKERVGRVEAAVVGG